MPDSIENTLRKIRAFRDERDWLQFHDPKSMAASIVIEAAELLEHFQWKNKEEAVAHAQSHVTEIADELADVAVYVMEFADSLGIDLLQAIHEKMKKNAEKYPIEKSKGNALKYSQLD